jgi:hypothetical protein
LVCSAAPALLDFFIFNRFLIIFQKTTMKFCFFKTNRFGGAVNHDATFLHCGAMHGDAIER